MTDAQFSEQRDRVKRLTDYWVETLGLTRLLWRINIRYHQSGDTMDARKDEDAYCTLARTTVQWQYMDAHIDWNLPQLIDRDDDTVEYSVVHELCHILVREMRCDGGPSEHRADILNHEERVVTHMARAFIWVRNVAKREAIEKEAKNGEPKAAAEQGGADSAGSQPAPEPVLDARVS